MPLTINCTYTSLPFAKPRSRILSNVKEPRVGRINGTYVMNSLWGIYSRLSDLDTVRTHPLFLVLIAPDDIDALHTDGQMFFCT